MSRRRKAKTLIAFKQHPIGTPLLLLLTVGVALADQNKTELYKNGLFNILGIFALLITVNIFIFRQFGLHRAFNRTKKIRYWTFQQKCKWTLYLFVTIMMFAPHNIIGGLLYLSFFICLIYFIFKGIWDWCKNINFGISSSKRTKVNFVAIEEIDSMDGRQFELFLSKIYDGLGYFSEVTPPSGDFGADVITIKDKTKTVIQAKCYGDRQSVGVEAINEVCGGAGYWNAQKKIVITNRYFTKSAILSAERNNVKLVDRDDLQLLLREYKECLENRNLFRIFSHRKQANN
ncbi:restriction endonuclease [Mesobacillus maritimus]|uniref:restriction endonuclease n=1 Tax=Mesobacillus maritimus TaxID=1643336 RepID=UPI0020404B78|nr:restriction endonuclease [Mesobacillus maritimus]MCM3669011.1 restriction endonuclease [Mesobacillus maritimus]